MELMATHPGACYLLSFPILAKVCRIMGEREDIPSPDVIPSDWICLLVSPETTHPQAIACTRDAPHEITPKPNETIAAAANLPTNVFRA